MSTEQRIRISRLLERMYRMEAYSIELGLEDRSTFHGEYIRCERTRGRVLNLWIEEEEERCWN